MTQGFVQYGGAGRFIGLLRCTDFATEDETMASLNYFAPSFGSQLWKDVIDPDAPMIMLPVGTISPIFNGWAHLNTDGTYTVVLGEGVTFDADGLPTYGPVAVGRFASLDPPFDEDDVFASIDNPFAPILVLDAFRAGGDTFFKTLLAFEDVVDIDSPPSGGVALSAPVVETHNGDDLVNGSLHDDTIYSGSGADEVYGRDGADRIFGGSGFDRLYGARGSDTIEGGSGDDSIWGGRGADVIEGGVGYDRLEGGRGDDTIHGGADDDRLLGNGGDDSLYGEGGDDSLYGQDGRDVLEGGAGQDFLTGGRHSDLLQGGGGHDTIVGGRGDDFVFGDAGNDYVVAEQGRDSIWGGTGDDFIKGGDGIDTAIYELPSEYYDIDINQDYVIVRALIGNEGTDTLIGVEQAIFFDGLMSL